MDELLIFGSRSERICTFELLRDAFPLAILNFFHDSEADDYIISMKLAVEPQVFFKWAATTVGPAGPILYTCLNLSLDLFDPPYWMQMELYKLRMRLGDGT
jgi:hypothetical protein